MIAMNISLRNIQELIVYPDDIHITNHTHESHIITIRAVIKLGKDNMLWFNENKYQFMHVRMKIMPNILRDHGLDVYPDKIETNLKLLNLGNKRQL